MFATRKIPKVTNDRAPIDAEKGGWLGAGAQVGAALIGVLVAVAFFILSALIVLALIPVYTKTKNIENLNTLNGGAVFNITYSTDVTGETNTAVTNLDSLSTQLMNQLNLNDITVNSARFISQTVTVGNTSQCQSWFLLSMFVNYPQSCRSSLFSQSACRDNLESQVQQITGSAVKNLSLSVQFPNGRTTTANVAFRNFGVPAADGSQVYCLQYPQPCATNRSILCPTNEAQIQALIREAYQNGSTLIRVVGSAHSYERVILDASSISSNTTLKIVSIQNFKGVVINRQAGVAVVQGGTILGRNPEHPENDEQSLALILRRAGYGLPAVSGVTRQTMSGYFTTGTGSGSTRYNLFDALVGMRLIDGTGTIHDIDKNHPYFPAVGVSLGLLGIITSVNISLDTPYYYIKGSETTSPIEPPSSNLSIGCPVDIFGNGSQGFPSLGQFFKNNVDYGRLFWYTQKGFNRAALWSASRHSETPLPPIVPYKLFPAENITAASIRYADILVKYNVLAEDTPAFYNTSYEIFNNLFPVGRQDFFDAYEDSLPMDNRLNYQILKISLFEIFVPYEKTQEVANVLRTYYYSHGVDATGNTAMEIYPATRSPFWLNPAYDGDFIKIGWYWFHVNPKGTPAGFFRQFADLFEPYKYRCHWGKLLYEDFSGQRVRSVFPMFDQFLNVRSQLDPRKLFVTPYMRNIFSL